jgi:cell wall-associated NlpC family hydrolase
MVRTGDAAVRWALARQSWAPSGMCQQFVRSCFDVPAYHPSAAAAWNGADHKHRVDRGAQVPRGVPVFWIGGSRGYGHIAISIGNGLCRSTDWPYSRHIGTAAIDSITRSWHEDLVGWSEDLNERRIWTPPKKRIDHVRQLQRRLTDKGIQVPATGYFGPQTRAAVTKWQRRLGYRGTDANGIPGRTSMRRLKFVVRV